MLDMSHPTNIKTKEVSSTRILKLLMRVITKNSSCCERFLKHPNLVRASGPCMAPNRLDESIANLILAKKGPAIIIMTTWARDGGQRLVPGRTTRRRRRVCFMTRDGSPLRCGPNCHRIVLQCHVTLLQILINCDFLFFGLGEAVVRLRVDGP